MSRLPSTSSTELRGINDLLSYMELTRHTHCRILREVSDKLRHYFRSVKANRHLEIVDVIFDPYKKHFIILFSGHENNNGLGVKPLSVTDRIEILTTDDDVEGNVFFIRIELSILELVRNDLISFANPTSVGLTIFG